MKEEGGAAAAAVEVERGRCQARVTWRVPQRVQPKGLTFCIPSLHKVMSHPIKTPLPCSLPLSPPRFPEPLSQHQLVNVCVCARARACVRACVRV